MNIRTQSWLAIGIALVLATFAGVILVDFTLDARATLARQAELEQVLEDVSDLQALTGSYAARSGARARDQWHTVHESADRRLGAAVDTAAGEPVEAVRLSENLTSAGVLFRQLVELERAAGSDPTPAQERLRAVLLSQIGVSLQAMVDDMNRWEGRVQDRLWRDLWRLGLGLAVVGIILAGIIFGSGAAAHRLVLAPLDRLREGIGEIGRSDGWFRFDWDRRDEIGQVADAFDAMADRIEAQTARQAETDRELRESEARFRQIAERIDSAFWITSPEKDRIEYVSPAYADIWDRPPETLYEKPEEWLGFVHPEDRDRIARALSEQVSGGYEEEYRIVRPDGEVRWIWDRAFPVEDGGGEVYRIVGVAEDITERKELEQQLRQSQKMEAVGKLAGGIAHDFNNLLTVIQGQADLLKEELDDPVLAEDVDVVRTAADRGAQLTRQLLAFSKHQMLRPKVVDLNEIIEGISGLLHRTLGEDVRIESRLADRLPPIRVDPGQMEQVLVNLAVNARDAMPGGGTLTLTTTREEPDVSEDGSGAGAARVRLDVADTGQGMDEDTQRHIFEPFYTTKGSGGTGLGLATVYGIVEQSGGEIRVRSEPGEGAVFTIVFPAVDAEAEAASAAAPEPGAEGPRRLEGRVLMVEDDPQVRDLGRKFLLREGLDVRTAANAETALEILEKDGGADLVLTDMVLPGMSGRDLVAVLGQRWPELPVVVMSGYDETSPGSPDDLPPHIAFLPKPFSTEELVSVIADNLPR